MHIATVKSNALVNGLQKVIKVRQPNSVLPVLECIKCKADKGILMLTCTNLSDTITTGIKADVKEAGKEFLIPVKAQNILLQLKDVDIEIYNGDNLSFKYGDNVIKVTAENVADYPLSPKPDATVKFKIDEHIEFRKLLEMHRRFSSDDSLRPAMTGVHFTNKQIASTDAFRLVVTKYKTGDEDFDVILSKNFITALSSIESAFNVKLSKEYVVANNKDTMITSRIIDAKFPDVKAVIPKDNPLQIKVSRTGLMGNIKLALGMTDRSTRRLKFTFEEEQYALNAADADQTEEIDLKGTCSIENKDGDKKLSIRFNGGFLHEQLSILSGDDVTIHASTGSKAAIFKEEDSTFLLMPLNN